MNWFDKIWKAKNKKKYTYYSMIEDVFMYTVLFALVIKYSWGVSYSILFACGYGFTWGIFKNLKHRRKN